MLLSSEFLLATLCVLLGALYLWGKFKQRGKRTLPGPWALPLLGNALQMGTRPHETFLKWSKIYGPIYKIKLGTIDAVIINDHKMTKELFSEQVSTGRLTNNPIVYEFAKGPNGVFNSDGIIWEQQRRFTLRTLNNFGFSKTSMEGLILDEARAMINWFKASNGKPLSGNRIFNAPVLNSLWRIVTGERLEWETSRPLIFDMADEFFKSMNEISTNGLFFAPVLRFIAPGFFGWDRYVKRVNNVHGVISESVKKHRETFNPDSLRDFIDHFLLEIGNTTNPTSSFYKDTGEINMIADVFDLLVAGNETTSNTLSWTLLYLSHHQEIQKKVQAEIDQILGSAVPSLSNKPEMPYTEAVSMEILRISSLVSFDVPHRILADTTFHGYHLPKDTAVIANLYGIHHDPEIWGDPENYRPERFLSEDGKSVVRHEALLPFSHGKRRCIGETLALNTLFLFLVSIFQNFNVHLEKGEIVPDFQSEIGFLLVPKPFNIVVSTREK